MKILGLWVVLIISACVMNGCTSVKGLFQTNEALLTSIAPSVTGPGCAAAGKSLQPGEVALVCSGLDGCSKALCPAK